MLSTLLYLLYVVVIGLAVVLMRFARDRPTVQILCMPLVQFAMYALARRAYTHALGEPGVLGGDLFLVVFWVVLALWPLWALKIAWRQHRGETFLALDGQRWRTVTTSGGVRVARPLALARRQHGGD